MGEEETVMEVAETTAIVVAEMTVAVVVSVKIERVAVVEAWRDLVAGTGAMTSAKVATDMSQPASSSCRPEGVNVAGTGTLAHAHHPHVVHSVLPSLLE